MCLFVKVLLGFVGLLVVFSMASPAPESGWTFREEAQPGRTECILTYQNKDEFVSLHAIMPSGAMFQFRAPALQSFVGDNAVTIGFEPDGGYRTLSGHGWSTEWRGETLVLRNARSGPMHVLFLEASKIDRLTVNSRTVFSRTQAEVPTWRLFQCVRHFNERNR